MLKCSIVLTLSVVAAGSALAAPSSQPNRSTTSATPAARAQQPVSRAQFAANVDKSFRTLDSNHDGNLTLQEINAAQAQEQKTVASQLAARRAQAFARLDTNKDGVLSQAEFNAGAPAPTLPDPSANFAKLDANHDGKVTADEFRTPQLARFNALDANHDGSITPQELQSARRTASRR